MVSFNVTKQEAAQIKAAVGRAAKLAHWDGAQRLNIEMSVTACHANGTRLDLQKLATTDDFTLVHDICGIDKNISHRTGKIQNHFLPRCTDKAAR